MLLLAKARLASKLAKAAYKVTPYPVEVKLEGLLDIKGEWDYRTDLPKWLVDDFSQRPGFRAKADAPMLHDELVAALFPSDFVQRAEFTMNNMHLKLTDDAWREFLPRDDGEVSQPNNFEASAFLIDLRRPTKVDSWTELRAESYIDTIEAATGHGIIDFRTNFSKVHSLTRSDCIDLLSDQTTSAALKSVFEILGQGTQVLPEREELIVTQLHARVLLGLLLSVVPLNSDYHFMVDSASDPVVYQLSKLLPSQKISPVRIGHASIGADVDSKKYAEINKVLKSGISESTLRFNMVHRVPISSPVTYSLEDLSSTADLETYKTSLASLIKVNPSLPDENVHLAKTYIKASECVLENLLYQKPTLQIQSNFFEILESAKASNGLEVRSPALKSALDKFITEVL